MSDEIRILTVELENYRQYYGKHKIEFSSREEGFTIISGKNGEGKSNLLNAISWCLYHEEPHGMGKKPTGHMSENKSLPVINNRYIKELNKGANGKTSVKIQLKIGEDTYSISRILEIIKHRLEYKKLSGGEEVLLITEHASDKVPKGCEIVNEDKHDFVIKKKGKDDMDFHDTEKDGAPNVIMNEILPHGLSKYFLLDGEFLEGFWKDPRIIRDGVEQISQLHMLGSLIEHVDKMRIPPKGMSKDTDEITSKIQSLTWFEKSLDDRGNEKFSEEVRPKLDPSEDDQFYHATGYPRISDLEGDIKKIGSRMNEITNRLPAISMPSIKILQENYTSLDEQFQKEKKSFEGYEKTYRYNLITKSPYIFLKDAIEESVKIIEKRMSLGDLPIRQRRQFADDLLTRGTCICGESLDSRLHEQKEANTHRIKIEKFKNDLTGKGDLDDAVDMRYDFTHDFIDKYDSFLKLNFGDPRKNLAESKERYDELNKKLKGLRVQMKSSGNDEIKTLIDEHSYLFEQVDIKRKEIAKMDSEISANKKILGNLRIQLEKGLKKNTKAKKLSHDLDVWTKIHDHLKQTYGKLGEEIRIAVQDNTWNNFQSLLANPNEFKSFKIEPDYSVYLLDQHDFNKIRDLSAGQSLILTLAFVAALREPTGYRFPLIVDSPLGKISGENKHNIGTLLPKYIPSEQVTLLVIDTEYAANLPPDPDYPDLPNTPFGKLLDEAIPLKHLKIQKEKSGENTGNSVIKRAKLVLDDAKSGWMVSVDV